MLNIDEYEKMNPYVRMMRLKRTASLSGKWRDIDHVFTYIASGQGDFIIDGNHYTLKTSVKDTYYYFPGIRTAGSVYYAL